MSIKFRRATAVGAFTLAGALLFSGSAFADVVDPGDPNIDGPTDTVGDDEGPDFYRFADEDRVSTAIQAAARTDLADGTQFWGDTVILASSEDFPDALAAAPYADAIDAPVLLNPTGDEVRDDVLEYLTGLEDGDGDAIEGADVYTNVVLVGGTDVFSSEVVDELEGAGLAVDRVAGQNRYQTAIQLANLAIGEDGIDDDNVFLASGTDFPDALTAGAAAAAQGGVLLLTVGDAGIDNATYAELEGAYVDASIVAVGGPAADAAENGTISGNGLNPVETDENIVGDDRYETAIEVAEEYVFDELNASEQTDVVLASGENFPDAVVGGAYAANVDGALLLTRQESLTRSTGEYLSGLNFDVENVFVFGGPDSVSRQVSEQLRDLEWGF